MNGLGSFHARRKAEEGDEVVAPLADPLRWAVIHGGRSVRIERRPAPGPVPSADEVAAAVAWSRNEADYQNAVDEFLRR